jgi:hypothetical protein
MASTYFTRITTTNELIEYALRLLGGGAITINVTDEQIQDRLFDALEYFGKYHREGMEYAYEVIELEEGTDEYELDDKIINVTSVMRRSDFNYLDDPTLNFNFQLYEDRLVTGQLDLIGYQMIQEKLKLLEVLLKNRDMFSFNFSKHTIKFHDIQGGEKWKIINCYKIIDHEENETILNNDWLKKYFAALIQIQWGRNITKFTGISMPGGASLNGEKLLAMGLEDKKELEQELRDRFEEPIDFFMA